MTPRQTTDERLRVLVVTNMYPRPEAPSHSVFVGDQVASLRASAWMWMCSSWTGAATR
jgi:hypothetical protein